MTGVSWAAIEGLSWKKREVRCSHLQKSWCLLTYCYKWTQKLPEINRNVATLRLSLYPKDSKTYSQDAWGSTARNAPLLLLEVLKHFHSQNWNGKKHQIWDDTRVPSSMIQCNFGNIHHHTMLYFLWRYCYPFRSSMVFPLFHGSCQTLAQSLPCIHGQCPETGHFWDTESQA